MERRVTSHTEEEEMNQRRRLLTLARKGDEKSIELLFELYQVKVFSGDALKKKKLPSFPIPKPSNGSGKSGLKAQKTKEKVAKMSGGDSKTRKGAKGTTQSTAKGRPKKETKTVAAKPSVGKSTKATKPSLKKKPTSKKSSMTKKASPRGGSKKKKLTSASKSRIAKKK